MGTIHNAHVEALFNRWLHVSKFKYAHQNINNTTHSVQFECGPGMVMHWIYPSHFRKMDLIVFVYTYKYL